VLKVVDTAFGPNKVLITLTIGAWILRSSNSPTHHATLAGHLSKSLSKNRVTTRKTNTTTAQPGPVCGEVVLPLLQKETRVPPGFKLPKLIAGTSHLAQQNHSAVSNREVLLYACVDHKATPIYPSLFLAVQYFMLLCAKTVRV
jgi:hypothetical protein